MLGMTRDKVMGPHNGLTDQSNTLSEEIISKRRRTDFFDPTGSNYSSQLKQVGSFEGVVNNIPNLGFTQDGSDWVIKYLDPSSRTVKRCNGIPDMSTFASHSVMSDQTNCTITVNDFIINETSDATKPRCPLLENTLLPSFQVIMSNSPELSFGIAGIFWYWGKADPGDTTEKWCSIKAVRVMMNKKYEEIGTEIIASRQMYRGITVMDITNAMDKQGSITGYVLPCEELYNFRQPGEGTKDENFFIPFFERDDEISALHQIYSETFDTDVGCYIPSRVIDGNFPWMKEQYGTHPCAAIDAYDFFDYIKKGGDIVSKPYAFVPWECTSANIWAKISKGDLSAAEVMENINRFSRPDHWSSGFIRVSNSKITASFQIKSYVGHQILTINRILMNSINPPLKYDMKAINSALYVGSELNYIYPGTYNFLEKITSFLTNLMNNPLGTIANGVGSLLTQFAK